jgi:hypothetical protein
MKTIFSYIQKLNLTNKFVVKTTEFPNHQIRFIMIVYKDLISGDEVLSDAFPLKQVLDEAGVPVSSK